MWSGNSDNNNRKIPKDDIKATHRRLFDRLSAHRKRTRAQASSETKLIEFYFIISIIQIERVQSYRYASYLN